jgi:alanine-glyoxylate transaminase/(R)-3-amino-2-methylpropionate-pyruvate transaminase
VIKEDKCQEVSKVVGTYLLEEFAKFRDEFEVVGDVRGKGLMIGLELVKDRVRSKFLFQCVLYRPSVGLECSLGKSLYFNCLLCWMRF